MTPAACAHPRPLLVAAQGFRPWDLGSYVTDCLRRRRVDVRTFSFDDRTSRHEAGARLLADVRRHRPRLLIALKLKGFDPRVLAAVRREGCFVALWYVDCFTGRTPGWVARLAREADLFLTTAHGKVDDYRALGVRSEWLVEGAHLPAFRARPQPAPAGALYASDVAFVGGIFQPPVADDTLALRRWRLLDRLGRRFDVTVWGPQNRPARTRHLPFPHVRVMRWPAYNDELIRVCQAAAIVLGVNTVNTVHQYFSNRTFLALACGGFHLTHYVPGLDELFTNHRHLVWYRDDDECVALCAHYLKRPAARRRIAEAGRALVRRRWSMARQVSRLLRLVERERARA